MLHPSNHTVGFSGNQISLQMNFKVSSLTEKKERKSLRKFQRLQELYASKITSIFLLIFHSIIISERESCSVMSDSLLPHGLQPARLLCPWDSPGKNTGVGFHALLQGIFPTQGLSPGLPHCRWIIYQLSHKGNPRVLEWVAYSFSSRSSQPRNQTRISYTARGFFAN